LLEARYRAAGTYISTSKGKCRRMPASDATRIMLGFGHFPCHLAWWRGPGTHSRLRNNKRRSRVPGAGASGRGALASTTDDRLSGLASDPLRPEGRTIPPLPAVPSVRIVRRHHGELVEPRPHHAEGMGCSMRVMRGDGDKLFYLSHPHGEVRAEGEPRTTRCIAEGPSRLAALAPQDEGVAGGSSFSPTTGHSGESRNPVCSACSSLPQPLAYPRQLTRVLDPGFCRDDAVRGVRQRPKPPIGIPQATSE